MRTICLKKFSSYLWLMTILLAASSNLWAQATSEDEIRLRPYEKLGGNFTLTNHHGSRVQLEDFQAKVVLLNFGYAKCPDICPLVLSRLKKLYQQLGKQASEVQILFITFDPQRDTPALLKNYLPHFHESFIGLTGSVEEISTVSKQYGAFAVKQEIDSAVGYLLAHTDFIYLIDRQGLIRALYRSSDSINQMKKDVQLVITMKN